MIVKIRQEKFFLKKFRTMGQFYQISMSILKVTDLGMKSLIVRVMKFLIRRMISVSPQEE